MLYVKIMSAEDKPDTDPYKNFVIVPVPNDCTMQFANNPHWQPLSSTENTPVGSCGTGVPIQQRVNLLVTDREGGMHLYAMYGNAYILSESGKTIASHGAK